MLHCDTNCDNLLKLKWNYFFSFKFIGLIVGHHYYNKFFFIPSKTYSQIRFGSTKSLPQNAWISIFYVKRLPSHAGVNSRTKKTYYIFNSSSFLLINVPRVPRQFNFFWIFSSVVNRSVRGLLLLILVNRSDKRVGGITSIKKLKN